MQYREYSFDIETYDIKPPVGGKYGFGGKVRDMRSPDRKPVNYIAHEHWGETKEEAFAKAHKEAKSWVDQQLTRQNT